MVLKIVSSTYKDQLYLPVKSDIYFSVDRVDVLSPNKPDYSNHPSDPKELRLILFVNELGRAFPGSEKAKLVPDDFRSMVHQSYVMASFLSLTSGHGHDERLIGELTAAIIYDMLWYFHEGEIDLYHHKRIEREVQGGTNG